MKIKIQSIILIKVIALHVIKKLGNPIVLQNT